jgi:hypothetical protein
MQDQFHITVISFYPLAAFNPSSTNDHHHGSDKDHYASLNLHNQEILSLEAAFSEKLNHNNNDIFSLEKSNHDREKMKQDAMVHFWLSEVSLLDTI